MILSIWPNRFASLRKEFWVAHVLRDDLGGDRARRDVLRHPPDRLHCAPLAHQHLGTFGRGAVRFSPGLFNTVDDIDRAIEALASLAGRT
jgi:hypothetical protein